MNKKITFIIGIGIITALFACRPEIKDIGEPASHVRGINGTWEVSQVDLIDLALDLPEEMNVSDFFIDGTSTPFTVSFNYDAKTYEVIETGPGNSFLGNSGTWSYDNPAYPTKINAVSDNSDTLDLTLSKMVRDSDNEMGFELKRSKCNPGENNVSYKYTFSRK